MLIKISETRWYQKEHPVNGETIVDITINVDIDNLYEWMTKLEAIEHVRFYSRTCFLNGKIFTIYSDNKRYALTASKKSHVLIKSYKESLKRNIEKEKSCLKN